MTLSAGPVRVVYSGTGSTSVFQIASGGQPISFRDTSHIHATEVDTDGVVTEVVFGTHYNIAGGPDDGTLTRIGGNLPSGYKLAIWREQPLSQDISLANGGDFSSDDIENGFDYIVEKLQEIDDRLDRAIKVPEHVDPDDQMEVPTGTTIIPTINSTAGTVSGLTPADLGGAGGTALTASTFGADFIQTADQADGRSKLGLGALATESEITAPQIATAHAATSHDSIIRAYNQANGQTVRQDIGFWAVESATTTTPPTIVNGESYLIPTGATGVWSGKAGQIASAESAAWSYKTPSEGWQAFAKDTDTESYYDGSSWVAVGGSTISSSTASSLDGRVVSIGKVNEYAGGGSGEFNVRVTADGRIVVTGDTGGLGLDAAGDNYGPFELEWDLANNGSIEYVYQGTDYLLIQTNQSTGNLWSVGLNATYGVLGHGDTTARKSPTRIAYFQTTNPVRISKVWTEAGTNLAGRFWFAVDTNGKLYSCGSGTNYTQGGNSTSHVTTPRPVTQSDGVTQLSDIAEVSCCSDIAPVFARTNAGTLWRWGSGTSGAAGQGAATDITWPTLLGGGTSITKAVITGSNITFTRAAGAIIQSGVLKVAGDRTNGIGDGVTSGTPLTAFTAVSGSLGSLTTTDVAVGNGELPILGAIDSNGDLWLAGYGASNIYGGGAAASANNTFTNPTLPATAQSTVTITNASPAVITWTGHKHANGDRVHFTTGGALPTGITQNTTYYVINANVSAGTFQISLTSGGAAINTSSAGSGTHTGKVNFSKVRIGGFNGSAAVYAEANGIIYTIGDDTNYQTGQNVTGSTAATRTWARMQGQLFAFTDWQVSGPRTNYGVHMLCTNGHSRYCGYNAQGQGGVQPSNLHAVPYFQMMLAAGPRLLKPPTPQGAYNAGTTYAYNDVVIYNGDSYAYNSQTPSAGNTPGATGVWTLYVQGGSTANVSATATFDTDNILLRADGTAKGAKKGNAVNDNSGNFYPLTNNTGTLGKTGNAWNGAWFGAGSVVNWNAGTITEASGLLTFGSLFPKWAAGTASNAPFTFTAGTNLTTAAAGAAEFDGTAFFLTAQASSRQVVPAYQVSIAASDFTGTDTLSAQPVFTAAQDTLALAATTTYRFRAHYWITRAAGTTGHTTTLLWNTSAGITNFECIAMAANPTGNALGTPQFIIGTALGGITVTASSTSATENIMVWMEGTICTSAAGNITPQFQFSAAPGGAPTIKRGTFFEIWPIGSNSVAVVGNWS